MDKSIFDKVAQIGESYGVSPDVLYSIIMTESGGNPNAHALTASEDSRGLFQVNVKAHPTVNSSMLFDPVYNANFIMPDLAQAYNQGKAQGLAGVDLALYTEKYGERPQWTSNVENSIRQHYSEYTGGNMNTGSTGTTPSKTVFGLPTADSISQTASNIMQSLKTFAVFAGIFIIVIFGLYMAFIYKD